MNRAAAFFTTLFTVIGDRFEDRKDRGATAVEYALIIGLVSLALIVAAVLLIPGATALFTGIAAKLTSAGASI
jgi:pilus assembly protein Flp/PilA